VEISLQLEEAEKRIADLKVVLDDVSSHLELLFPATLHATFED
jgi:hypothetical protein